MSLILAIEPDRRQAAQLTAMVRGLGADLILVETTAGALDAIGSNVPDLVLVPALLSPQDDAALAAALRVIAAAARVQMLTTPVFATAPRPSPKRGVLAALRRGKATQATSEGCAPSVFAEQVGSYLERVAQERTLAAAAARDESSPTETPLEESTPSAESFLVEESGSQDEEAVSLLEWLEPEPDVRLPEGNQELAGLDAAIGDLAVPAITGTLGEGLWGEPEEAVGEVLAEAVPGPVDEPESASPAEAMADLSDEALMALPDDAFAYVTDDVAALPVEATRGAVDEAPVAEPDDAISSMTDDILMALSVESTPGGDESAVAPDEAVGGLPDEPQQDLASAVEDDDASAVEDDDALTVALEEVLIALPAEERFGLPDKDEPALGLELAPPTVYDAPLASLNTPDEPIVLNALSAEESEFDWSAAEMTVVEMTAVEQPDDAAELTAPATSLDSHDGAAAAKAAAIASESAHAQVREESLPAFAAASAPEESLTDPSVVDSRELWMPLQYGRERWPSLEGMPAVPLPRSAHRPSAVAKPSAAPSRRTPPPTPGPSAPSAKNEREWVELIESLRHDVERLRAEGRQAETTSSGNDPNPARRRDRKGRTAQDEWGFFDPEQCGFAALLAKLDEVTEQEDRRSL